MYKLDIKIVSKMQLNLAVVQNYTTSVFAWSDCYTFARSLQNASRKMRKSKHQSMMCIIVSRWHNQLKYDLESFPIWWHLREELSRRHEFDISMKSLNLTFECNLKYIERLKTLAWVLYILNSTNRLSNSSVIFGIANPVKIKI